MSSRFVSVFVAALVSLAGAATLHADPAAKAVAPPNPIRQTFQPDPAVRAGVLPNGLRWAVMRNTTPAGLISLRLGFDVGSAQERADEMGAAHFVEHMAFRGARQFPEETLDKVFAPAGVAFGRDQNAATTEFATTYRLDLPAADAAKLDLGLRWLRDLADDVVMTPDAVDSERRVVLAEAQTHKGPIQDAAEAAGRFLGPDLHTTTRPPVGTVASIAALDARRLQAFYDRWYRPENAVIVIVGDQPVEVLEAQVKAQFSSWKGRGPAPDHAPWGRVDEARGMDLATFSGPTLPNVTDVCRIHNRSETAPYDLARLRREIASDLWNAILNQRLDRLAAAKDPPFVQARLLTIRQDRETERVCLVVAPVGDSWDRGLAAARQALNQFLIDGASEDELDDAVKARRATYRGAVSEGRTRASAELAAALVDSRLAHQVFTDPAEDFRNFDVAVEALTPGDLKAAAARDWSGSGPLIVTLAQTPPPPEVLRLAWTRTDATPAITAPPARAAAAPVWAYESFGPPGRVVRRQAFTAPDFVRVTFRNGVIVNFKSTDSDAESVRVRVRFGEGRRGLPAEDHLAAAMAVGLFKEGGLGRHDVEEIKAIFAQSSWQADLSLQDSAFVLAGDTLKSGLRSQLQLMAAYMTDPGFRSNIDARLPTGVATAYRMWRTNPSLVINEALLEAADPRSPDRLPPEAQMARLRMADVERILKPAVTRSPLEVTVVGDVDEKTAIAELAATFGALPPRPPAPPPVDRAWWLRFPDRPFPEIHVTHEGARDTAMVGVVWPLYVATPKRRREEIALGLLAKILTDDMRRRIRQDLGASYSPEAETQTPDFGDQGRLVAEVETTPALAERVVAEIRKSAERMARGEITAEALETVRKPRLAALAQWSRTNGWWLAALDGSARNSDPLDETRDTERLTAAVTLDDVRKAAADWLSKPPIVVVALPSATAAALQLPAAPAAPAGASK